MSIKSSLNEISNLLLKFKSNIDNITKEIQGGNMNKLNLIPQNHPKLPKAVRLSGCRYRCLQAVAEMIVGKSVSLRYIEQAYHKFKKEKDVMLDDCTCGTKEFKICQDAYTELTLDKKTIWQNGYIDLSSGKAYSWTDNKEFNDYEYIIREYKTPTGKHFVLLNKDRDIIFDPWSSEYDNPLNLLNIQKEYTYGVK